MNIRLLLLGLLAWCFISCSLFGKDEDDKDETAPGWESDYPKAGDVDAFTAEGLGRIDEDGTIYMVALLEGGYAVEVDTAIGEPRLVAVEVGFFGSNNMIAVTSDALQSGDRVVVP